MFVFDMMPYAIDFRNLAVPQKIGAYTCADTESFVRGGPTLTKFFKVDEGREDSSATISRLSLTRQRNAINWRFAGVPMMAQH